MNVSILEGSDLTYEESLQMGILNYFFQAMNNSELIIDFRTMTHFKHFAKLFQVIFSNNISGYAKYTI
ncbi:hypothetical protein PDL13_20665 [Bacillus cereus]|nr:hypothetical protein [Bacillus cereus]